MKAIAAVAPQSCNLGILDNLNSTLFKSLYKSARRRWLRANLAIRQWCRSIAELHSTALLVTASLATLGAIMSAAAGLDTLTAILALAAFAAISPEMLSITYAKEGGEK